jgi:hypothetical protein
MGTSKKRSSICTPPRPAPIRFEQEHTFFFSMYGGDRFLTEMFGDLEVVSYDVGQGIVRARDIYHQQPRLVFKLTPTANAKSDLELYNKKLSRVG